jgi:hypothetical protein
MERHATAPQQHLHTPERERERERERKDRRNIHKHTYQHPLGSLPLGGKESGLASVADSLGETHERHGSYCSSWAVLV